MDSKKVMAQSLFGEPEGPASLLPAWQEGAVLSSLDAVTRLHGRITAKA